MSISKPLTKRQKEFLVMSARGMGYEKIAKECVISINTVRATFGHIRERIEAESNSHAIIKALARNELEYNSDGICFVAGRKD